MTLHTGERAWARYVSRLRTIDGGSPGHAMCPGSTDCPVYPSKAAFPLFSGFSGFFRLSATFRRP